MNVTIIKGDVTNPTGDGNKIIVHCVNDLNVMGSGVAKALYEKWPQVKEQYHKWGAKLSPITPPFRLGNIQFVLVGNQTAVCNLIGQKGMGGEDIDGEFIPAVRYEAIREGLLRVRKAIRKSCIDKGNTASLHLPMLGSALAGGSWEYIYWEIIRDVFYELDVECTIYAFDDVNYALAKKTHDEYEEWDRHQKEIESGDIIA